MSGRRMLAYLGPQGTQPVGPASILGSQPAWWLDGSAGSLVDAGGGVASSWADSSGNALTATFAVGQRPTINAAGKNGKTTASFSALQFGGNASFAGPAPGTTLSYFFAIARPISVPDPAVLVCNGTNNVYTTNMKALTDNNGLAGAISPIMNPGTWYRIEILRTNSASDYIALNGTTGTLGSAGNNAGTGYYLNGTNTGGALANWEYAEIFQWTGATAPDATKRAALAAYSSSKWAV